MRRILAAIAVLLALLAGAAAARAPDEVLRVNPQSGTIAIPAAQASLALSEDYVFYGPADARTILFDLWGNPADRSGEVLGLIMPAGSTPQSDSWGAVVTFEAIGHVSASDARSADYDALLAQLQAAVAEANAGRRGEGYQAVELVGWAQPPRYDSVSHAVIWARELAFAGEPVNTLNLDLRTLGRAGVLSLNFVADMPDLPVIRDAAQDLAGQIAFDAGARYEDFDAASDPSSGYGIAGLVAGGAGLAVAQKAGLLAVLLNFLKPALAVLAVLLIGLAARFRHVLGWGKKAEIEGERL